MTSQNTHYEHLLGIVAGLLGRTADFLNALALGKEQVSVALGPEFLKALALGKEWPW